MVILDGDRPLSVAGNPWCNPRWLTRSVGGGNGLIFPCEAEGWDALFHPDSCPPWAGPFLWLVWVFSKQKLGGKGRDRLIPEALLPGAGSRALLAFAGWGKDSWSVQVQSGFEGTMAPSSFKLLKPKVTLTLSLWPTHQQILALCASHRCTLTLSTRGPCRQGVAPRKVLFIICTTHIYLPVP